jgi:hypothetical protein
MKQFFLPLLAVVALFTSCKKEPVVEPTPEPQALSVLSRKFTYPTSNTTDMKIYETGADSLRSAGKIDAQYNLTLSFDMPYSKGQDYVVFNIESNKIKPGFVGEYELLPILNGSYRGDAQVAYGYKRDVYSYTEFPGGNATGKLSITSYDEKTKTVAGNYTFHIDSFHDPKVGMNWVETKIDVSGAYQNVLIR